MKIVATADLHGVLPKVPPCDLLIVAGDVVPVTHEAKNAELDFLRQEFYPWLERAPAEQVLWVAGNHDFALETVEPRQTMKSRYLRDGFFYFRGLRIWGTPWTPNLPRWAFQSKDEEDETKKFSQMPDELDILISHGPPYGYGDYVTNAGNFGDKHVGGKALAEIIKTKEPKTVICGHIHEAYGQYEIYKDDKVTYTTTVLNVSHMTEEYRPINAPIELEIS